MKKHSPVDRRATELFAPMSPSHGTLSLQSSTQNAINTGYVVHGEVRLCCTDVVACGAVLGSQRQCTERVFQLDSPSLADDSCL